MKYLIILSLLFFSCQTNTSVDTNLVTNKITYFRDSQTGICFASINSVVSGAAITSIACVPCDSLKKFNIPNIK